MNIIVIGGGAAGLMAAGTAAEQGAQVTLLETNEKVGRKLFITGKGRCNVCNNCDVQEVLRNVPVNPRFLYSALGGFGPADVMDFFENHPYPPEEKQELSQTWDRAPEPAEKPSSPLGGLSMDPPSSLGYSDDNPPKGGVPELKL